MMAESASFQSRCKGCCDGRCRKRRGTARSKDHSPREIRLSKRKEVPRVSIYSTQSCGPTTKNKPHPSVHAFANKQAFRRGARTRVFRARVFRASPQMRPRRAPAHVEGGGGDQQCARVFLHRFRRRRLLLPPLQHQGHVAVFGRPSFQRPLERRPLGFVGAVHDCGGESVFGSCVQVSGLPTSAEGESEQVNQPRAPRQVRTSLPLLRPAACCLSSSCLSCPPPSRLLSAPHRCGAQGRRRRRAPWSATRGTCT